MSRRFIQQKTHTICELFSVWDEAAYQTITIKPLSAIAVLFSWEEPDAIDGGPSPALSLILSRGLIALGPIAFRARGAPPAHTRIIDRINGHGGKWIVVSTTSVEGAVSLFEERWDHGEQAAVIGANDNRAMSLVSAGDLRAFTLSDDEWLWSAAVDGDGGVLAAATADHLDVGVRSIVDALLDGHFIEVG